MFRAYPFLPHAVVEAAGKGKKLGDEARREVAEIYESEKRRRGGDLFDGLLFSVEGIDGERISGRFVNYSLFIAQSAKPELFDVLGVRPLGVSGLLVCSDGIVFGRRNVTVTQDPGLWELAPSGGIDPSCRKEDGRIDAVGHVLREMHEEIGAGAEHVSSASPFVVIENTDSHVIDIGIDIKISLGEEEILRLFRRGGSNEYTDLMVIPPVGLAEFSARCEDGMAEDSRFLLQAYGLL